MIEAVNAMVANASTLRAGAEVVSSARTAAEIAPVIQVGETSVAEIPKAPYVSPYIVIDRNYNRAVLQIRDSDTGDVLQQFPTESRLAQITRTQQAQAKRQSVKGQEILHDDSSVPKVSRVSHSSSRTDITTVQEATSSAPANVPFQAVAAFSAGEQAGQSAKSVGVSVLA